MYAALKGTLVDAFLLKRTLFDMNSDENIDECPSWVLDLLEDCDDDGFGNFIYSDGGFATTFEIGDSIVVRRGKMFDIFSLREIIKSKRFIFIDRYHLATVDTCVKYFLNNGIVEVESGYQMKKMTEETFLKYFVPWSSDLHFRKEVTSK